MTLWTNSEITQVRRAIAYRQRRMMSHVSKDEALMIMAEQQRRYDTFFPGTRWTPARGWFHRERGEPIGGQMHPCAIQSCAIPYLSGPMGNIGWMVA